MKNFLKYPWLTIQHRWRKFWITLRMRKIERLCKRYCLVPYVCAIPLIRFATNSGEEGKEALAQWDHERSMRNV